MVEFILDSFPGVASWQTDIFRVSDDTGKAPYALHCACYNDCRSSSVIELLLKEYPPAVEHLSRVLDGVLEWGVKGLSLHYYISRNPNIDIDVIKLLVEAYPQSLVVADETKPLYPIHVAAWLSPNLNTLCEIIEYFLDVDPTSLCVVDEDGNTPLHFACVNHIMNLEVFKLLYNSWPEAIRMSGSEGKLPVHELCRTEFEDASSALDILRFMLDIDQTVVRERNEEGELPIHSAVVYESTAFCRVLIDAYPQSLRVRSNNGKLPIHETCQLGRVDTVDTILYMLDIDQTVLIERNEEGELPIHHEDAYKSTAFCKILIDAYPESLRVRTNNGELPIHKACRLCRFGEVDTILYMLELYPESIRVRTNNGSLPIHIACKYAACKYGNVDCIQYMLELYPQSINETNGYGNLPIHCAVRHGSGWVYVIETLLKHDPTGASKKTTGKEQLPLHIASSVYRSEEDVQILYDAYPQAIHIRDGRERTPLDLAIANGRNEGPASQESRRSIVNFLQAQLVHAQKAKDTTTIMTLDENGWLPLHHALKDKAPLGSIKLLLKGNPSALMTANLNIAFPLHIACEFGPIKVVKYLIELDINGRILEHCDTNKDSVLHYACRGSNFGVIEYLLGNHASLVSDMNADNKLPLHMLLEGCEDKRVTTPYDDRIKEKSKLEACFLLLRAHPETVMVQTTLKRRRD